MRGRKTILGFCSNLLCIRSIYQSPIKGLQNLNGLFNFLFHRFSVERFHLFKIRVLILFSSDLLCVSCSPISSVKLKNTSCSELWFRHVSSHWSESLSDGSVFLVMCQICICIWNGSGDTFSGFLTGCYHPVYSGMSVDSLLVVEKMAALCAMFLSQSEKTFIFFCVCYESQELQLYGFWHTYSCTCEALLIGCIDRAIPQSLSWSGKAVVLTSVSVSWMVPLGRVTCTNLKS